MIDKTAIIDSKAKLSKNVKVGPYCVIGPNVEIGENTIIHSHVNISGNTKIGKSNKIYPFVSINDPQDLKYNGEPTNLVIGDNNKIREYVTINPGTVGGGGKTVIGNDCLFMISSHIAHDCQVGNHLIMSSHSALGGHVKVADHVNVGWGAGIHQFCRLGHHCMVSACSKLVQDVAPYMLADGSPAEVRSINKVGMERSGYKVEDIEVARGVFKTLYKGEMNRSQAIQYLQNESSLKQSKITKEIIEFVRESDRGLA